MTLSVCPLIDRFGGGVDGRGAVALPEYAGGVSGVAVLPLLQGGSALPGLSSEVALSGMGM